MKTVHDFQKAKEAGRKISMITCYDSTSALLVAQSKIDCVLVGDSVAMVMHGHATPLPAGIPMMAFHTQAVASVLREKFLISDLPFLSYRKGLRDAMNAVEALMKAGAAAVKLEGVRGHRKIIRHIIRSGIPVMGHIGLTPQSVHSLGGFRVQGKDAASRDELMNQAKILEDLGCFSIVLECVPSRLGEEITQSLLIPTIGIGAGPHTDGQVLVWQDLLGLNPVARRPRFVRTFLTGAEVVGNALDAFHQAVQGGTFPSAQESYDEGH